MGCVGEEFYVKMLQQELNVIKLKREMEQMLSKNAVNMKRLNEILETLRTMEIDLEILRKTKIGVCVNNVRKTFKNSKEIAKTTAELIRKWKKIAKEEFRPKLSESDSGCVAQSPINSPSTENGDDSSSTSQNDHPYSAPDNSKEKTPRSRKQKISPSTDSNPEQSSGDDDEGNEESLKLPRNAMRRKSIDLLEEALKGDAGGNGNTKNFLQIAVEVESYVYKEHPDPADKKYKAKIRSRVMNLRDKNNPEFRKNVLEGDLKPDQVAKMSVEEMASAQLKKLRQSIEEETIKERELKDATVDLAQSTMFVCPGCSERDTSYTITQDRLEGEYEPVAVTLILCNQCGHRWKHF